MKNNEGGKTKKKGNGKQCREIPISFKIIVGREITIYIKPIVSIRIKDQV